MHQSGAFSGNIEFEFEYIAVNNWEVAWISKGYNANKLQLFRYNLLPKGW